MLPPDNASLSGDITLRLLSEADLAIYWPLRLRALKEEPESFGGSYEESVQFSEETRRSRLKCNDDAFVFGAFYNNLELIGTAGLFRVIGNKSRHKGTLWGMYVAPEHRGKGVGKALARAILERAATLPDLEQVNLTVVVTRAAARNLYLSLGFEPYGLEKNALKIGDRYVDEEFMAIVLPQA